ncbi:MAG: glycerol dehydrogenase [Chlorobiaceae bacterium]|nr:glycerol dehydrogenase [Chlorobiaceae bacterium]
MLQKALFPGKYIQGAGALGELPSLVRLFGNRGMILASPSVYTAVLPESGLDLKGSSLHAERFGGECSEKELSRVAVLIAENRADVLVGMGGGKTIDTAKIAADRAGIPVIIVPTIASTDAPCSGCAVIYTKEGVYESACYQQSNPAAVLVDTEIIAKAPVRFLVAGMGDALATWFEANSCSRTQSPNECGGLSTLTGLSLARLCYDTLMQYGPSARIAARQHIITPALEHIVEANILLSGVGFESGGLASAHSIHNGLTALTETHAFYHGEKVAFGLLAGLQLTDAPPEVSVAVYAFCEEVGLPTTLADIGLGDFDRERLMPAAEKACAPAEFIHHEAGSITPEKVLQAMLMADAIGASRKKRQNA